MKRLPRVLIGTGIIAGVSTLVMKLLTDANVAALKNTVTSSPSGSQPLITVHLTGYWPFQPGLTAAERRMEGAPVDRKGQPLHTVEDFLAGDSDHVSLSGDPDIFPYGQRIDVPWGDKTIVGRVTDTGGHFHGAGKVYRVIGAEPIDVCVDSSSTKIPKTTVDARVIVGDNLDKSGAKLALDKAGKPQTGLVGIDIFAS